MLKFSGGGIVPGVSRAEQVTGDNQLPQEVEVVVIGGGLVGCVTVLNLAERGVSVVLCEKGAIAGEASAGRLVLLNMSVWHPSRWKLLPDQWNYGAICQHELIVILVILGKD